MYLDVRWTCGGEVRSFRTAVGQLSDAERHHQDSLLLTAHILYILYYIYDPLHPTHPPNSTAMMSFTRLSSTLVLQARNAETKRLGYEAVYLQQRQLNNTKHISSIQVDTQVNVGRYTHAKNFGWSVKIHTQTCTNYVSLQLRVWRGPVGLPLVWASRSHEDP